MWLLAIEAIVALSLLVLIVWWTMFSGNPKQNNKTKRSKVKNEVKSPDTPTTPEQDK
jgi:cyanate permease